MTPRVSVLMPVRNGLPWLPEALDSLSRQTLEDLEILALEDGSTDGTRELLDSWPDDRLRIISTHGVGIAAALNVGLEAARAPFVARQDADDVSAPDRLEKQAACLTARTDVAVLATTADYIDEAGRPVDNEWVRTIRRQQDVALHPDQIRALMPLTCCVTHGSVMARRAVVNAAGGYRQDTAPAEDYDLWLRLLPGAGIAKLPERLYRYRVHGGQVSSRSRQQQLTKTLAAKFAYVRRLFPQLPSPARLVIAGSSRGADWYRALAPACAFTPVAPPPSFARGKLALLEAAIVRRWVLEGCEAVVVADFAEVEPYARALGADMSNGDTIRVGNFFIPRRVADRKAA
jgi:hypothetical protein